MDEKYSVHVRDIMISDPCVLASPDTKKYYIYARMFDPSKFPEVKLGATFYAMESPDLIHWSRPILVFDKPDGDWLVFAASVGHPQTDEYIPLVVKLSRMGVLQVELDTQMDTAPDTESAPAPMTDGDEDGV